ncbi:MAG: hypothetical protein QUU85_15630, partial [Candidatus Eisenbacteria bacterium]|nr:hypothetical protein [Candidatus Eisenbacteria bacterium]
PGGSRGSGGNGANGSGGAAPAQPAQPVVVYPEGPVIEFKVLEFGVDYPTFRRRFLLFGDATVHRIGGVYITASRIDGPEGKILDVASGQSHFEDRLSGRSRMLAEGANYPFAKPEVPPLRLGRYVEPLAVVAIVSSLVYLFYQNQN